MLLLAELTPTERERFDAGGWRAAPRALVESRPEPLSATEAQAFRMWRRLSPGRQVGAMGGAGNIAWGDVQAILDRSGVTNQDERERLEELIYVTDQEAQRVSAQLMKARAKNAD